MKSTSPTPDLPRPIPATHLDAHYRLRKGTAMRAIRSGCLTAVIRRGRGGQQAWVLPDDAKAWFANGLPTILEVKS